jgi:hypothetical protein
MPETDWEKVGRRLGFLAVLLILFIIVLWIWAFIEIVQWITSK